MLIKKRGILVAKLIDLLEFYSIIMYVSSWVANWDLIPEKYFVFWIIKERKYSYGYLDIFLIEISKG